MHMLHHLSLGVTDIERMMDTIQSIRATNTYMVPTHFAALFAMGEAARRYDVSSLKAVVSGTAPLAQAMKARIIEVMGEGRLYERYGTTETSIAASAMRSATMERVRGQRYNADATVAVPSDKYRATHATAGWM